MKKLRVTIIVCLFAVLFFLPSQASATIIPLITAGQNGVVLADTVAEVGANTNGTIPYERIADYFQSTLAAYTSVTFSFSVTSGTLTIDSKTIGGRASYDGSLNGIYYNGQANAWSTTGAYGAVKVDGYSGGQATPVGGNYVSLALLSYVISVVDSQHATVTITNNSPLAAYMDLSFATKIAGTIQSSGLVSSYTAVSTLVSAVPLPATLPLFVVGLLVFVPFMRTKTNRSV